MGNLLTNHGEEVGNTLISCPGFAFILSVLQKETSTGVLCKILFMCRVEPAKTLKLKARRLEIYCQVHVVTSPMHINRKIFILLIVKCDHEYFRCGGGSRVIVVGIMQGKAT